MKRTFAYASFALLLGISALAQAATIAKHANCKDCCNDKCGQNCCKDGCTGSCCNKK